MMPEIWFDFCRMFLKTMFSKTILLHHMSRYRKLSLTEFYKCDDPDDNEQDADQQEHDADGKNMMWISMRMIF